MSARQLLLSFVDARLRTNLQRESKQQARNIHPGGNSAGHGAGSIKKEELEQYCAMVNIESLGMAAPQAPVNLSSSSLVSRVGDLAQRMKIPFNKVTIAGLADSVSFIGRKIPAITISAVGDGWEKVLHSDKDRLTSVNQTSVYLGYRLALALVVELNGLPCEVSRKDAARQ